MELNKLSPGSSPYERRRIYNYVNEMAYMATGAMKVASYDCSRERLMARQPEILKAAEQLQAKMRVLGSKY